MKEKVRNRQRGPLVVEVLRFATVTEKNLKEVLGVTAFDQHRLIDLGDVISVIFFHDGSLERSGMVTIWHNKEQAAIKTPSATLSGRWCESEQIIVTKETEESWTLHGEPVRGKLAMDTRGVPGIYSCGAFYPMAA